MILAKKKIVNNINLEKLPFKVLEEDIFSFTKELSLNLKKIFSLSGQKESVNWCFASQKRIKVFLIIFNANENIKSIYKEEIAKKLPEYSYKTIAQIVDQGVEKEFFVELNARATKKKDLKIRNIRPSEQLVIEFINWNIEVISVVANFQKKYK